MTIEQRLERVVEIGRELGNLEQAQGVMCGDYRCSLCPVISRMDKALALWMEYNEVVRDIEMTIGSLVGLVNTLRPKGLNESTNKPKIKRP